jgi:hypothetical protein
MKGKRCSEEQIMRILHDAEVLGNVRDGRSLQLGEGGIAADIRYAFGTPLSGSKRRPMPDAMPQRQHMR